MSGKITTSEIHAEQRMYIKFCVELGKTPVETKTLLEKTQSARNVSRALVYRWHKRFSDGQLTAQDEKRTGRPLIIDENLTLRVQRFIAEDGRQTVREVGEGCGIGKTTADKILTEYLHTDRVCAHWVPRILSDDDRPKRVAASKSFMRQWKSGGNSFLDRIVTTDETWLYYYDPETKQQSSQWVTKGSGPPGKARVCKSAGKTMCIMFMDRSGILLTHFVPRGQTVNAAYYSKVVRRDLVNAIRKKRPEKAEQLENVILHQDNAPPHTAAKTQFEISWIGFNQIAHSPYSPDVAPMDFAVFPCIKSELKGLRFTNDDQLKRATMRAVRKLDNRWCNSVFEKWVQRHKKCIEMGGIYFEKK